MTDTLPKPRPVPEAARFRPRQTPPSSITWTTDPDSWTVLDEAAVAALPAESRRTLSLAPGVYVTLVKVDDGTFTLLHRKGIPGRALAGIRTAPRVPIDPGATSPEPVT